MGCLGEHALCNGKLIPASKVVLSATDRAVQSGFGVYESLRVIQGRPVYLQDHMLRLERSACGIEMKHPFRFDDLTKWIDVLLESDSIEKATLRVLLMGGDSPSLIVTAHPLLSYPDDWYRKGVFATTYAGERFLPRYKTCAQLLSYLALRDAQAKNAFEAILVDRYGYALEGTRSNFFAFRNHVLYTADESLVLEGVTRDKILKACECLGFSVVLEPISLSDIVSHRFDEVFISSTSMGAMGVCRLDDTLITSDFARTNAIHDLIRKWEVQALH